MTIDDFDVLAKCLNVGVAEAAIRVRPLSRSAARRAERRD